MKYQHLIEQFNNLKHENYLMHDGRLFTYPHIERLMPHIVPFNQYNLHYRAGFVALSYQDEVILVRKEETNYVILSVTDYQEWIKAKNYPDYIKEQMAVLLLSVEDYFAKKDYPKWLAERELKKFKIENGGVKEEYRKLYQHYVTKS